VGLSPKLWAFTLGAAGAIADAELAPVAGWLVFIGWVIAAQAPHLLALLGRLVAPARADALLARIGGTLERRGDALMIGVGLVFGAWFLVKALMASGWGRVRDPAASAARRRRAGAGCRCAAALVTPWPMERPHRRSMSKNDPPRAWWTPYGQERRKDRCVRRGASWTSISSSGQSMAIAKPSGGWRRNVSTA
jgi:hypothetical protein